ncbi:hypothetical protein J6590_060483 [Homalodisca vitripennis]|nr:hypothetical protein J6590_060483 [Homalodisca vitripennis]
MEHHASEEWCTFSGILRTFEDSFSTEENTSVGGTTLLASLHSGIICFCVLAASLSQSLPPPPHSLLYRHFRLHVLLQNLTFREYKFASSGLEQETSVFIKL